MGATFKVGNGNNCRFWQDFWLYDVPLKICFEDLYRMVRYPECSVSDCWVEQDWFVDFHRALSGEEFQRWTLLYDDLQHISLADTSTDVVI